MQTFHIILEHRKLLFCTEVDVQYCTWSSRRGRGWVPWCRPSPVWARPPSCRPPLDAGGPGPGPQRPAVCSPGGCSPSPLAQGLKEEEQKQSQIIISKRGNRKSRTQASDTSRLLRGFCKTKNEKSQISHKQKGRGKTVLNKIWGPRMKTESDKS